MKKIIQLAVALLICLALAYTLVIRADQVNQQTSQNNIYESEK